MAKHTKGSRVVALLLRQVMGLLVIACAGVDAAVLAPNLQPIMNVYYSPAVVDVGKSSRLYWSTANISRCELLDGTLLPLDTNGSGKGNPVIEGYTKTTSVRCYSSKGVIIRNATLTVNGTPPLPKITAFNSNSLSINRGQTATLSWSATDAISYSMDNGVVIAANATSVTVTPSQTTTYKLTATGQWGSASQTVTVVVVQPDSDGDGVPDYWEMLHQLNQTSNDALLDLDEDGLTNLAEYEANTNPKNADTDADGLPDKYEINAGLDPLTASDALLDSDADGANNLYEFYVGTDLNNAADRPLDQQVEYFASQSLPCGLDGECYSRIKWKINNYQSACLITDKNEKLICAAEGYVDIPVSNSSVLYQIWNSPAPGTGVLSNLSFRRQTPAMGAIHPSVTGPCDGVSPCRKQITVRYLPSSISGQYAEAATLWRYVDGVWRSWKVVYSGNTELLLDEDLVAGHLYELRIGSNDLAGVLLASYVSWRSSTQQVVALSMPQCERRIGQESCSATVQWNKDSVGGEGSEQCLMNGNLQLGCTSGNKLNVSMGYLPVNLQLRSINNLAAPVITDGQLTSKAESKSIIEGKSCLDDGSGYCDSEISWYSASSNACLFDDVRLVTCAVSGKLKVRLQKNQLNTFSLKAGATAGASELASATIGATSGILDVSSENCKIAYPENTCEINVNWAVGLAEQACLYNNNNLITCGQSGINKLILAQGNYSIELRKTTGIDNSETIIKKVNVSKLPWGKIVFPYKTDAQGRPLEGVSGSNVCVLKNGASNCFVRVEGVFQNAPANSYATLWRMEGGNWINYFSRPVSDLFTLDLPNIIESPSEFKLTWRDNYETPVSSNELMLDSFVVKAVKETAYQYSLIPSRTYCYRNADASSCQITVDWETNDLRSESLCLRVVSKEGGYVEQIVCKPEALTSGVWKGKYQISVGENTLVAELVDTKTSIVKASVELNSIIGYTNFEVGECIRKTQTLCSVEVSWQSDVPNTCIYGGLNALCADEQGNGHGYINIDYELSGYLELRVKSSGDLLSVIKAATIKPKVELAFSDFLQVNAGSLVTLKANVTDPDSQFRELKFFVDGEVVSTTRMAEPFEASWVPVASNTYSVHAEIKDRWGNITNSAVRKIIVSPPNLPNFEGVRGVSDFGDALLQGLKWTPLNHADALVVNTPNATRISYNKLTKFNVNRPLKIINRSDSYNNALWAARLIVVDAAEITVNSNIEVLGEPADILLLNASATKNIQCTNCSFKNVGRLTFGVATPTVALSNSVASVGVLKAQSGGLINLENLQASGVMSVEAIAEKISTKGIINTQQYTADAEGNTISNVMVPGVSQVVGSGGVSLLHGQLDVDYETLLLKELRSGSDALDLGANISSGAINVIAVAPINVKGMLNTSSTFRTVSQYQGKLRAQSEVISLTTLAASAGVNNYLSVNSALITDGKLELTSQADIVLTASGASASGHKLSFNAIGDFVNRGQLKASRKYRLDNLNNVDPEIEIGAKFIDNRGGIDIYEQIINVDKSLSEPRIAGKLTMTATGDVLNRFGGSVRAETIKFVAQSGRIRNGSLYAFDDATREQETIVAAPHDTQSISTLSVLPVSDSKPFVNPKAIIQGVEIQLEANTSIENINPYTEPLTAGLDEQARSRVSATAQAHAEEVRIEAVKKLTLVAPQYILNSSAHLGVSEFSLVPSLIIQSPQVRNERYYSYTMLETVDETKEVMEQNSGATTTTRSTVKGVQARYGFYSPPGVIYSFAPVHIQFGNDSGNSNAGLLNNAGFIDIYSTVNLYGTGKVTSLGVKLDRLAYETTSSTRTVLNECINKAYWNGYGYVPQVICEQGNFSRTQTPEGKYIEPILDNTLFSVAGRLDAPGLLFSARNHEVLKNIREQAINDYMAEQRGRKHLHQAPDYCEEKVDVDLSPDGLSIVTRAYFISKAPLSCPGNSYAVKTVSELVAAKVSNVPYELNSMISRYESWKSRAAQ